MPTLDELFSEVEAERLEAGRALIEAEERAWLALPQAERDRINAERRARVEAMFDEIGDDYDEGEDDE